MSVQERALELRPNLKHNLAPFYSALSAHEIEALTTAGLDSKVAWLYPHDPRDCDGYQMVVDFHGRPDWLERYINAELRFRGAR